MVKNGSVRLNDFFCFRFPAGILLVLNFGTLNGHDENPNPKSFLHNLQNGCCPERKLKHPFEH